MQTPENYVNERLDHLGVVAGVCEEIGLALRAGPDAVIRRHCYPGAQDLWGECASRACGYDLVFREWGLRGRRVSRERGKRDRHHLRVLARSSRRPETVDAGAGHHTRGRCAAVRAPAGWQQ